MPAVGSNQNIVWLYTGWQPSPLLLPLLLLLLRFTAWHTSLSLLFSLHSSDSPLLNTRVPTVSVYQDGTC